MSAVVAVLAAAVATVLAVPAPRRRHRLTRVLAGAGRQEPVTTPAKHAVWIVSGAAVLVVGATMGMWFGLGAGAVALGLGRRRGQHAVPLDVPLVADLLAACLAAGATTVDALGAAGNASPEAAAVCRTVADRLAAGAPAREAWAGWLQRPDLAAVARACVRAADSGAATTAELRRAGDRVRSQRRAELNRRAQRAAVWAVLPLGVCFLPAFVLVGIVPFALGLFGR